MEFLEEYQAFLEEQRKGKEQDRKIQEQDRRIQEQQAMIVQLKKEMETVVAQLKEHDSKIQSVSNRLEMSDSAARMVVDSQ